MPITQSKAEFATIDVERIVFRTGTDTGISTSMISQIQVTPQIETVEAVKLVVKGKLVAQKGQESTLTGNQIVLTDNVANPELHVMLQGGTIQYDTTDTTKIVGYTPPAAGSGETGITFEMDVYTNHYDTGGTRIDYECTTYPNCKGVPFAPGSQDGTFRTMSYTINSAPSTGQPPYKTTYVKTLPPVTDGSE